MHEYGSLYFKTGVKGVGEMCSKLNFQMKNIWGAIQKDGPLEQYVCSLFFILGLLLNMFLG